MAVPDHWKEEFSAKNLFPNEFLIKKWYEKSDNTIDNPSQLIDLNDRMKVVFAFLKGQLKANDILNYEHISKIIDNLKQYYKNNSEKSQKSDLIFIDLLIQTEINAKLIKPDFRLIITDFDQVCKKFMPQFIEHFKVDKLAILGFEKHMNRDFLSKIRTYITVDVLENLDKESINEQEKGNTAFKFIYESHLEYIYIEIIITLLKLEPKNFKWLTNWFENYPFRMLNKNGLTTPDNFFLSASKYINSKNPDSVKLISRYLTFFYKLKDVRIVPAKHFDSPSDFLDSFDTVIPYIKIGNETITSDINMRSICFREDFDYLNSLLIRNINLNRKFWTALDNKITPKPLGFYIKAVSTVRNLDEFFDLIKPKLSLSDNFVKEMKYSIYEQQNLCSPDTSIVKMDIVKNEKDSLLENLSDDTYTKLKLDGATPLILTKIAYPSIGKGIAVSGLINNMTKVVKMSESDKSRVVQIINYADINPRNPEYEKALFSILEFTVAADVSTDLIGDKVYMILCQIAFGFEEKKTRQILQLEKAEDPVEEIVERNDVEMIEIHAEAEQVASNFVDDLDRLLSTIKGSTSQEETQQNEPMAGGAATEERFFHKCTFVNIHKDAITQLDFDINNMKKQDILEFIKKIISTCPVTYYKLYFSIGEKEKKLKLPKYPDDNHEKIMEIIKYKKTLLSSKIGDMNKALETKTLKANADLELLIKAEKEAFAKREVEDTTRIKELQELKNKIKDEHDAAKIAIEKTIAEGQAKFDEAVEMERLSKTKLELAVAEKTAMNENNARDYIAEVEAEEERITTELANKKINDKKVAGFKSRLTKTMSTFKKDVIDPLEILILEDNKKLEKLKAVATTDTSKQASVRSSEAHIAEKIKLKKTLEKFTNYEFMEDTKIRKLSDAYMEALTAYNQPFIIKTRESADPRLPKIDNTFDIFEKKYDALLAEINKNIGNFKPLLAELQPLTLEIEEPTDRRSGRIRKASTRCKEEGYDETVKGWCHKKDRKKPEPEPEESKRESKKGKIIRAGEKQAVNIETTDALTGTLSEAPEVVRENIPIVATPAIPKLDLAKSEEPTEAEKLAILAEKAAKSNIDRRKQEVAKAKEDIRLAYIERQRFEKATRVAERDKARAKAPEAPNSPELIELKTQLTKAQAAAAAAEATKVAAEAALATSQATFESKRRERLTKQAASIALQPLTKKQQFTNLLTYIKETLNVAWITNYINSKCPGTTCDNIDSLIELIKLCISTGTRIKEISSKKPIELKRIIEDMTASLDKINNISKAPYNYELIIVGEAPGTTDEDAIDKDILRSYLTYLSVVSPLSEDERNFGRYLQSLLEP